MNYLKYFVVAAGLLILATMSGGRSYAEGPSIEGHGAEETGGIELTQAQRKMAGIEVLALYPKTMSTKVYAPGEVKANGYTSYYVSPRVDSVVIKRHITLGQHVERGQPLVTLFSDSVAEAQGVYRIAYAEWQRVKRLGKSTVSAKRLLEAKTNVEASRGRLRAYGLSDVAIAEAANNSNLVLGEYQLDARQAGAVLSDEFHQGQAIAAGNTIIVLANENVLWVEARLAPNLSLDLPAGTRAELVIDDAVYIAEVIQEAHTIDATTRTRVIRLEVKNLDHRLHPGMFGDVNFLFATDKPVMALSEDALMRSSDGDWTVFVETLGPDGDEVYAAVEVELGRSFGNSKEILGLSSGTRVVSKGAFFVASQIAKGGFDPHNH